MKFRSLLVVAMLPAVAASQVAHKAPGATISGVVRDSVAGKPLAGAMVQLVNADGDAAFARTSVSDSLGAFTLGDIPEGRFTLGFFHPMLDSLGVEAPLRSVQVTGQRSVRADLAIPSPARLRAAICGTQSRQSTGAVLLGVVRDARGGTPLGGATVTAEWLEVSLGKDGVHRRMPRILATTGENGWFAMCNVPSAGTIALRASRGADSTDLIEVIVPSEGFLRRELFLGSARSVVVADTMARTDSIARAPRRIHLGNGVVSGTVVAVEGGKPLPNAQVSITDGPQTRANERGEWTISDAPVGTRMLEVRALGYYPERRRVDVVSGAPPVRVALSTLKAVLDTVKIRASRLSSGHVSGFHDRRRSGMGRYITAEDIARRHPVVTSDLFRTMSGVRLEYGDMGVERYVLVRGNMSEWCAPSIYLDGLHISGVTADDVDVWVGPNEIEGMEIYPGVGVPPEYQRDMNNCGAILIWTKARGGRSGRESATRR